MNKRILIGVVGAFLGVAVLGGIAIAVGGLGDDRRLGATQRTYVSSNWALELNGIHVGFLKSADGCGIGANVVNEQADAKGVVRKHIGQPVYDPCVIQVGLDMHADLLKWISDMLARKASAKNLSIISADYDFKEKARTNLTNAHLVKVKFPNLEAKAGKEAGVFELTLQPELSQSVKGDGSSIKGVSSAKKSSQWLRSNFRLKLGGIEVIATKVEGLEVAQELVEDTTGTFGSKVPGEVQLGDLSVTVPLGQSSDLDAWFDDFVVKGNNAPANEKSATIEYLDQSMKKVLFTISLSGLGIFKVAEEKREPGSDKNSLATKKYDLYVEEISFAAGVPAPTPTPTPTPSPTPTPTPTPTPPPPAPEVAAQGQLTVVAAAGLLDGETFTLSDGVNAPTIFEFDSNAVAKGMPIRFGKEETADKMATLVTEAVNGIGRGLAITATHEPGSAVVVLTNDSTGVQGNVLITDTVLNKVFLPKGMSGGTGAAKPQLVVPSGLKAGPGLAPGEIDLSWEPTSGALSYVVLMKTDPDGVFRELDETKDSSITIGSLRSGAVHYFAIYAVHEGGDSANSNEASATAP